MNKKEPLPIDNTGTGKLGSIRVLTKKEKKIQKECIKQLNKYMEKMRAKLGYVNAMGGRNNKWVA